VIIWWTSGRDGGKNTGERSEGDKDTKGNNFLSLLFNDNLSIKIICHQGKRERNGDMIEINSCWISLNCLQYNGAPI
jgi:hypothetical protein